MNEVSSTLSCSVTERRLSNLEVLGKARGKDIHLLKTNETLLVANCVLCMGEYKCSPKHIFNTRENCEILEK